MENLQLWLLFLAIAPASVLCKRYDIPQHWNLSSESIGQSVTYQSNRYICYSLISNGTMNIVSDNGIFSLVLLDTFCFAGLGLNTFSPSMLAVMMQRMYDAVPVWTFRLDADHPFRKLSAGFSGIQLDDTGNLALLVNSAVVWQSNEHPRNILLPGHRLRTGMSLQSQGEYDEKYVAEVSKSRFILFVTSLSSSVSRIPYNLWSLEAAGSNSSQASAQTLCQGYETILTYTGSELLLSYEAVDTNASGCHSVPHLKLPLKASDASQELPYLELDNHGDLVLYKFETTGWRVDSKLSDTFGFCKLPAPCGIYGEVCDAGANVNNSCRPLQLYDQHFEAGMGYFATKCNCSAVETVRNVSMDGCKSYQEKKKTEFAIHDSYTRDCFLIHTTWRSFYADKTTKNLTLMIDVAYIELADTLPAFVVMFLSVAAALWLFAIIAFALVEQLRGMANTMKLKLIFLRTIMKYNFLNFVSDFSKAVRDTEALLLTMQGLPRRYNYMELENATKGFTTKIGAGGFGSVYEGMTSDGRHVAVKKLASISRGAQMTKQFVTELVGVGGISHVNIVKLYGFCVEGASRKLLVYEFMPNGSLDKWIFGGEKTLTWEQRFEIALGTARGLAYLHDECSEPILHLDIKPQNILLDDKFVPKVADFGVAKLLANRDVTQTETGVRGTIGYLAPEWFMRSVATKKCDVYSYGMVLLELIGGRKNVDLAKVKDTDQDGDSDWYFPSWVVNRVKQGEIMQVVDERVRACAYENNQLVRMVHIALWCIQDAPSVRPSMQEVVEMLEGHRTVGVPTMSFHFDADPEHLIHRESSITTSESPY